MSFVSCSFYNSGHQAINTRMKARYRVGGYIDEIMGGIAQLDTVRDLLLYNLIIILIITR